MNQQSSQNGSSRTVTVLLIILICIFAVVAAVLFTLALTKGGTEEPKAAEATEATVRQTEPVSPSPVKPGPSPDSGPILLPGTESEEAPAPQPETEPAAEPETEPAATTEPEETPGAVGDKVPFSPDFTFTTVDLDGNTWTEAAFAEHSLTMMNFWEPWCGPCVGEMPELQRLQEDYADRGLQIVGIYSSFDMLDEVMQVLADTGVQYPILEYRSEFDRFDTGYVPTTVFVDGSGHVVSESIVGSKSYDAWAKIVEDLL